MRGTRAALLCGAAALLGGLAFGCGGGGEKAANLDGGGDAPPAGMCNFSVPAGQACHPLTDMGSPVKPTCAAGTIPSGSGGNIVDGVYVLTAQTLYNAPSCPSVGLSQTLRITGTCLETTSGAAVPATGSGTLTVSGSSFNISRICVHFAGDGGFTMAGPSVQTFDATATTLTLYTDYTSPGQPGTDNVAVYTRL